MDYLAIFVGGGLGSMCRYGVSKLNLEYIGTFPIYTLIANVLSSFILGFVTALFLFKWSGVNPNWKLLLATGFCGGFSTFSTFGLETFLLIQNGSFLLALLNMVLSITLCLGAIYAAYSWTLPNTV